MTDTKKNRKRDVKMIKVVGDNIRKHRKLKGLTISEFAFLCEVEARQIGDYELGKVDTNITMLCLMARKLGIEPGDLFIP